MQKDLHALDAYEKSKGKAPLLSFAGKWAPREKKQFDKKFQVVDDTCFPKTSGKMRPSIPGEKCTGPLLQGCARA